jgi:predicted DNA binding CopG/RHH family protein
MPRIDIRLSEEEKHQAQKQASKLGLNVSEYIKLIVKLDAATKIISKLKDEK